MTKRFDINLAFNLRVVKMAESTSRPLRAKRTPNFHNAEIFDSLNKEEKIDNYATLANPYKRVHSFSFRSSSRSLPQPLASPNYWSSSSTRSTRVIPLIFRIPRTQERLGQGETR